MKNLRNEIIEAQRQYNEIIRTWKGLNHIVKENLDTIILNGCLLNGKEIKGIYFKYLEADYYAPRRVWVYDHNTGDNLEIHEDKLLKKVNNLKIIDAPCDIIKINLNWATAIIHQLIFDVKDEKDI